MLKALILLALVSSASFAFSIDSYYNHVSVLPNGDLKVTEDINFTLEKQYNQGYRQIRAEDAPSPDYVELQSVKVDGTEVGGYVDTYDGQTEVVWNVTHEGKNEVELQYVLKDRAEEWDDYARVCYEHFGANWPSPATLFRSAFDFPPSSAGRTVHFQIYSAKEGNASLDNLTVSTEIHDVPAGVYVGGCYLFPKDAVNTSRVMNGSAFAVLQDERSYYGSQAILAPEPPMPFGYCCIPAAVLLVLAAVSSFFRPGPRKMEESILPPSDHEEPAVAAAIVRNVFPEKDILAATILDLIDRGNMDIVELEKKGADAATVDRERTVLLLKKTDGLKPYEKAVVDMIFEGKKEAVLDDKAKEWDGIRSQSLAKQTSAAKYMDTFTSGARDSVYARGDWLENSASNRGGIVVFFAMFAIFIGIFVWVWAMTEYDNYAYANELWLLWATLASLPIGGVAFAIVGYRYALPRPIKGHEDEFASWQAFERGVKASRLKEYPPSSVAIWGRILVYATALGMADKVKKHLSELDSLTAKRLESMDSVRRSSYVYYASGIAASNLAAYGNRAGASSVSSGSSGGWSSGGGGGFSSGSSGGGGFR